MVGGQVLDLALEASAAAHELDALEDMHRRKTAALFEAAAEMGAIAAGREGARTEAATYGRALGLLFQAVDDLLDVESDAATLGKTPGKDAALERATLVRALGLDGARERAAELAERTRTAARSLGFGPGAAPFELAEHVLRRPS
jgi:geranylgeranyl diphosphate synthase type II